MPIYEYQCRKCGEFEVTQRITDDPLKRCPTCRGKVTKLISNTSFQLKGTGWYVTDYARKGSAKEAGEGGGESKGDSSAKETTAKESSKKDAKGGKKSEGAQAA